MLGGGLIARMLRAEGVDVVFGIIDSSYMGLYTQLREYGIRLITPRHEIERSAYGGRLRTPDWQARRLHREQRAGRR